MVSAEYPKNSKEALESAMVSSLGFKVMGLGFRVQGMHDGPKSEDFANSQAEDFTKQ